MLKFLKCFDGDFNLLGLHDLQEASDDRPVSEITPNVHTGMGRQPLPFPPVTFVHGIEPTVTLITDAQATTAIATDQESLEESKSFPDRPTDEHLFSIAPVLLKFFSVSHKRFPGDVPLVVIPDEDNP
jgi:hypothetical protein